MHDGKLELGDLVSFDVHVMDRLDRLPRQVRVPARVVHLNGRQVGMVYELRRGEEKRITLPITRVRFG